MVDGHPIICWVGFAICLLRFLVIIAMLFVGDVRILFAKQTLSARKICGIHLVALILPLGKLSGR